MSKPNKHFIKLWDKFYKDVETGKKNFEIRFNDRKYQVNDILVLEEFNPRTFEYTGKHLLRKVTKIHNDYPGVRAGYVLLEIEKIKIDYE